MGGRRDQERASGERTKDLLAEVGAGVSWDAGEHRGKISNTGRAPHERRRKGSVGLPSYSRNTQFNNLSAGAAMVARELNGAGNFGGADGVREGDDERPWSGEKSTDSLDRAPRVVDTRFNVCSKARKRKCARAPIDGIHARPSHRRSSTITVR